MSGQDLRAALADVRILMSDIDDTITLDGALPARAYAAIEALSAAGIAVIPVTGRPAGWCDMIARFWPVAGVIGENGAFWFSYDRARRRMEALHALPETERLGFRARLDALAGEILAGVPGCALASDQPYRLADLAVDFCEDVPPLPPEAVARIVALFEAAGATAKVSSIHVNGWFGNHDKLTMARRVLGGRFGLSEGEAARQVAFIGDSPNDEPMFAAFPLSVGVANVRDHAALIRHMPRFVMEARGADGFVALAQALLDARAAPR